MVDQRKSILDAANRMISIAAKDGKSPLAKELYALQKEENYEQALLQSLASMIAMIIHTVFVQNLSTKVMACTKGEMEKIEDPTMGREVDAVSHGDVVAIDSIYNYGNFRIQSSSVTLATGNHHVRSNRDDEFFLVVDAGDGRVAFFNASQNRFLAVFNGILVPGFVVTSIHDCPRAGETFELENQNGLFSLFCPSEKVYVTHDNSRLFRMNTNKAFHWKVIKFNS